MVFAFFLGVIKHLSAPFLDSELSPKPPECKYATSRQPISDVLLQSETCADSDA